MSISSKRIYSVSVGSVLFCSVLFALEADSPFHSDGFSQGHHAGIVDSGNEALILRLHLLRHATTSIDLQSFIWINDDVGYAVMNECVRAAERGVRVRILLDHQYSERDLSVMTSLSFVHPNYELRIYRPLENRLTKGAVRSVVHSLRHPYHKNQRMHNKVLVVDGEVCVVSGRNLSNHYFGLGQHKNYLDRDVLVAGPVVDEVSRSFDAYWDSEFCAPLAALEDVVALSDSTIRWPVGGAAEYSLKISKAVRLADDSAYVNDAFVSNMARVKRAWLAVDPPGKRSGNNRSPFPTTTQALADVIATADSSVVMQTPYVILGRKTRRFFARLKSAKPELSLSVLTNSYASIGNMTHYSGSFRSRAGALDVGMKLHELKPDAGDTVESGVWGGPIVSPNFLAVHAKSLVVDGRVACIGSTNLTPRSITLNTEIAVFIEDEAFARKLTKRIERNMLPVNSWQAGMRSFPGARVNRIIEKCMRYLPFDLWPIASTASFDGERSAGALPGVKRGSRKHLTFRGYKIVGPLIRPLL
jgi:phosphatidylserine/phosphatidylglycerophosphate/cardiolipin synthase-like enzyme